MELKDLSFLSAVQEVTGCATKKRTAAVLCVLSLITFYHEIVATGGIFTA